MRNRSPYMDRTPWRTRAATNWFRVVYHTVLEIVFSTVNLQDVFKSVEKLCAEEGIDCAKFMYRDNTSILDTLEGHRFELCKQHYPVYLVVLWVVECGNTQTWMDSLGNHFVILLIHCLKYATGRV